MKCPECKEQMAEQSFEGRNGAQVTVDVCHGCRGLWFDTHESRQLSPGGTLHLFREMHGQWSERRPYGGHGPMSCPRCDSKLQLSHDLAHNNRFQYSRCPKEHGHFISFFHFLREKGIARSLTPRELTELRKHVDTLLCSDCGEPVRVANLSACVRCQAPLSILDPDCVQTTVRDAQMAAGSRRDVAPEVAAQLLMTHQKLGDFHPKPEPRSNAIPPVELPPDSTEELRNASKKLFTLDLIAEGIAVVVIALGKLLF
ncbi:zf-TFIIB domain-containing protein [Vitiosangium sp. GDMCC 1.1324]|uniref:TFIIB-type zinc ribbon-containing protein n=1 Tax=Vitiosangium sp. (strain GDMCC 1.1324) TaxID=2138576 RepID=UPI000D383E9D|nr:zf-TFIIB domain-containing protein [Vitiosangium sp. GDMCC 1.1324]PTL77085.1 hypothetical protein DAT35_46435 [Vitiosangium sp. GDMCC 1.1324]